MHLLDPREYPEALQPRYGRTHRRMAWRRTWNVLLPFAAACALLGLLTAIGAAAWQAGAALAASTSPIPEEEPISP